VLTGTVGSDVEYAAYVHDGTRPHVIRPKAPNRVLAWGGRPPTRFAAFVRHPGTQARPFLRKALEDTVEGARA
jgi:hypothetical protein